MRGAMLYGKGDVRLEERAAAAISKPTDAIVRVAATCICGSDLWPYRGISPFPEPTPMGHEYCGIVEDIGRDVTSVKPGRRGGYLSYVGVPHGVELNGEELFYAHVHMHGGPAPVRRFLPQLIDLVLEKRI